MLKNLPENVKIKKINYNNEEIKAEERKFDNVKERILYNLKTEVQNLEEFHFKGKNNKTENLIKFISTTNLNKETKHPPNKIKEIIIIPSQFKSDTIKSNENINSAPLELNNLKHHNAKDQSNKISSENDHKKYITFKEKIQQLNTIGFIGAFISVIFAVFTCCCCIQCFCNSSLGTNTNINSEEKEHFYNEKQNQEYVYNPIK
jgi:hypothetical protein